MISFHGDLDPVVPYGYGFPFTALITLPAVYGSSVIHPRLQHLGIYSEFVPFPGQGHNVWGTVVANNFVGGPTQYWDPILVETRDFLWRFLQPETGPISGIGYSYPNAIETYSVPFQAGFHWCWTVNGGTIVSANPYANTIDIQWQTLGLRTITARAFNHLDAAADTTLLQVVVGPVGVGPTQGIAPVLRAVPSVGMNAMQVQGSNLPSGDYVLELIDMQGKRCAVWHGMADGKLTQSFAIDGLAAGIYALQLRMTGLRITEKILMLKQ